MRETLPFRQESSTKQLISTPRLWVSNNLTRLTHSLEHHKNEGILTNRAMAYIKKRKYKDALFDCEQALYINDKFAKAHLRAYTCYLVQGSLEKAKESIQKLIDLE